MPGRIEIDDVAPVVSGGVYPAKAVVGEVVPVSATVWREATDNEVDAAVAFYRDVIEYHGVELEGLQPRKAGMAARSNEEQAAFDFTRKIYATFKVGARVAAQVFDANIAGEAILTPEGKRKPQPKRALRDSVFGSKEWGAFLTRMFLIRDDEAQAKRKPTTASSDLKFVLDRLAAVSTRLNQDASKFDGSIDTVQAPALAKALHDVLVAFKLAKK